MSDRELLELAAKAAGLEIVGAVDKLIVFPGHLAGGLVFRNDRGGDSCWNPLQDDGDALRLAVDLGIRNPAGLYLGQETAQFDDDAVGTIESHYPDPYAATRRAIVRAAAEIGSRL